MTQTLTLTNDTVAILTQRGLPMTALIAVKLAVCVNNWAMHRRTRLALRQLEPWQLRDVGLTPEQAETEAARVFWKV